MRKATITIAATTISIGVLVGIAVAVSDFHDDGASTDKGYAMGPDVTANTNTFEGYFDFWQYDEEENWGMTIRSRDASNFEIRAGTPLTRLVMKGDLAALFTHENSSILATLDSTGYDVLSWAYTFGTDQDGGAVELMANGNQHLYLDQYNDFELTGPSGAALLADHDGNAGLTSGEDGSATLTADAGGQVAADAEGDVAMTGVSGTSIKVEGEDVVISFAGGESYSMKGPSAPDSTAQEARAKRTEAAMDLLKAAEERAKE